MDAKTFRENMRAIIIKYCYTATQVDYESIISQCLEAYQCAAAADSAAAAQYRGMLERMMFDLAVYFDRAGLRAFADCLYRNGITGDAISPKLQTIPQKWMRLRITLFMLKRHRLRFFMNQYELFENVKIRYFVQEVLSGHIAENFRYFFPGHLRIPILDIVVTTKCTLRCKHCFNLISQYKTPYDVDKTVVLESIRKIQECTEKIDYLVLIGGEAFCNPNLKVYLEAVSTKICQEIWIMTNGTLLPDDEELFTVMKEKGVLVVFSGYGKLSGKQQAFIEVLKERGIRYAVDDGGGFWLNYGGLDAPPHDDIKALDRQFIQCSMKPSKSLLNGSLYFCPRSSHGYDLGVISRRPGEYVDVLHNSRKENIRQIKKLCGRKKHINACRYCLYMTDACTVIPRAEQVEKQQTPPPMTIEGDRKNEPEKAAVFCDHSGI